jgi:ABC-type sugar transport system, permease component
MNKNKGMGRRFMPKKKVILYHLAVIVFGIILLYPLLWMLSSSFKDDQEIFNSMNLWPSRFVFENYTQGWSGLSGTSFGRFFINSFILVGFNIIGTVMSCSFAAYAFAKKEFRLKKLWFALMMGTMMLPIHVTLIPTYIMFDRLGWINTYLPLIVPSFFGFSGFFIFLMTQFMRNIPKEIDEAAKIDGCNAWNHYLKIIMPMSLPAIITTCIFTFIWTWNDFFSQMIYLTDVKLFTVGLALRQFVDATGQSSWGSLFAMTTISLIPLFLIFVFLQQYLIEGVTAGSVKG